MKKTITTLVTVGLLQTILASCAPTGQSTAALLQSTNPCLANAAAEGAAMGLTGQDLIDYAMKQADNAGYTEDSFEKASEAASRGIAPQAAGGEGTVETPAC